MKRKHLKFPQMLPVKAWAIVRSSGHLITMDYRLPICWYRAPAKEVAIERGHRIIRVEVREIVRRKGK